MAKSRKIKKLNKKVTFATIRKMAIEAGLVVLSLEEYNSITSRHFKTFKPTKAQMRAFRDGEREFRAGKCLSLEDVRKELGFEVQKKSF